MENLFLISLIPAFIYLYLKNKKSMQMLQQNFYNTGNRYLKWLGSNLKKEFLTQELFFVIFLTTIYLENNLAYFLVFIFYTLLIILYKQKLRKEQTKIKLNVTARIKRMRITYAILYFLIIAVMYFNFNTCFGINYFIIGLLIYLDALVLNLVNIINKPVEKCVFLHFKRQAKQKLKDNPNMDVIGITGSYGKTSSKNILDDILNVKFQSFKTPKNFNTTYGLILTLNNYLDSFNDYFIAEMGAFKKGEIKELCDLVKPKYGIITKIGTAHLTSFGSQENIQSGKMELVESLPSDGVAILNKDDELQVSYKMKNDCKVIWIGIDESADVMAKNIKLSASGTTFDVIFNGDKTNYKFSTKLLGKANIYNILASIALGKYLGLTIEELQRGVLKVNQIKHRLELKKVNDITYIDDAYNSNPVGSKMALDVLKLMDGKKIVVTPGMIELGDLQYDLNFDFGKQIAEVADTVILVGETQTKPILDGLKAKKYKDKNIYVINDVKEAFTIVQKIKDKDTFVLLENDLPDLFNEG
ncbi:MAG: UDP-N-acetylmuramoyl-tripeptide--D-alanyl-D-alanine ligase [Mycoplasmatota bacterium]